MTDTSRQALLALAATSLAVAVASRRNGAGKRLARTASQRRARGPLSGSSRGIGAATP